MTDLVSIPQETPQDTPAQPQGRELKWFIIHTYSGYEAKVMEHLRQRIQMEERQDSFGDIQIPEETYEEMKVDAKSGKKERVVKKRKSFPGYLRCGSATGPTGKTSRRARRFALSTDPSPTSRATWRRSTRSAPPSR